MSNESMRVLVGIGASDGQFLPYLVLKRSIEKRRNINLFCVEKISQWGLSPENDSQLAAVGATQFSWQRFLVPKIARSRGFDAFIYLDSDMLALRSLDLLINEVVNSDAWLVLPEPDTQAGQALQTAVYAGLVSSSVEMEFSRALQLYRDEKISYKDVIRFHFMSDRLGLIPSRFNSRELVEPDTVLFHMTDLYTQPWVSRFNRFGIVWENEMRRTINESGEALCALKEGIKTGFYRPGLIDFEGNKKLKSLARDLFFVPPEFGCKLSRKINLKNYRSWRALSYALGVYIQVVGIIRFFSRYRRT